MIRSALLPLVLTVGALLFTHSARAAPGILLGDADGSGKVTAADAAVLLQYEAGLLTFSGLPPCPFDTTGDGVVNSVDALAVLQFDAGLIGGTGWLYFGGGVKW